MKKRQYMKPSMKVYEFGNTTRLLVGSENFGYTPRIPGMGEDEKHLA